MWRILTRLCITKINIYSVGLPKELCKWSPRLNEDNPLGGVVFNKSKSLVSCTRTCQDPVGHTSNSTVTTCADGITEHTEDEGLSVNICCSSASALCQTGNNDGKSSNFPSYLYHRKIQSVEPVSLERSDFEGQQENSGKQDEEEDGMLEYDSPSDDDIPPVEWEAYFYLGRDSRLGRSIHFNSRIVFSYFFLISVVMKPWDCRDLLCFMHLLKLLFVSDTDLPLSICLAVIEVWWKEVVTETSVRYSCKTLKTSKMNNIILLVKRDKLAPYGDYRRQRINAG